MQPSGPPPMSSWLTTRNIVLTAVASTAVLAFFGFGVSRSYAPELLSTSGFGWSTVMSDVDVGPRPIEKGVEARLEWGNGPVPTSTLVKHAPGWTIIDKLFMLNGTYYIVTDTPSSFPERRKMISSGYIVLNPPEEVKKREPTDKDMMIISRKEAKQLFAQTKGASAQGFAQRMDGVSFLNNDPDQFIKHYYHFSAELLFGFWRAYSSLDTKISPLEQKTVLQPPRRLIFRHSPEWRDYASMNQYVWYGSFPSSSVETSEAWDERMKTGHIWVFDRVLIADRAAAMRGREFTATERTASEPFLLPWCLSWWTPVRASVVEFAGVNRTTGAGTRGKPVITYVSRQEWGRRMLIPEDHDKLVAALHKLEAEEGYEVNVVSLDKMERDAQIRLAARTTVMIGVHGNGLTSLLWMNPTPRSTIIEFFFPGGFAYDYEWTARALGMVHYGFWGSDYFTSPKLPPVAYPEGFQGNSIPIDGQKVADLIKYRVSLAEEADD